jgi:hypothetical protein
MTAERTNEIAPTIETVEFIDSWLGENAMWVDSRVMDFALDVRTLLSSAMASELDDLEHAGADAS